MRENKQRFTFVYLTSQPAKLNAKLFDHRWIVGWAENFLCLCHAIQHVDSSYIFARLLRFTVPRHLASNQCTIHCKGTFLIDSLCFTYGIEGEQFINFDCFWSAEFAYPAWTGGVTIKHHFFIRGWFIANMFLMHQKYNKKQLYFVHFGYFMTWGGFQIVFRPYIINPSWLSYLKISVCLQKCTL